MPPTPKTGTTQSGSGPLLLRATLLKGALNLPCPEHAPDAMHVTMLQAASMARQVEQSGAHQAAASPGSYTSGMVQWDGLRRFSEATNAARLRWGGERVHRSEHRAAGQSSCSAASC